jgi:hypothetical protein
MRTPHEEPNCHLMGFGKIEVGEGCKNGNLVDPEFVLIFLEVLVHTLVKYAQ